MLLFSSISLKTTHRGQLVLHLRAGIHEGLGDNGQRGIHYLSYVHVKDEVGVFQDVNPESQRQTVLARTHTHKIRYITYSTFDSAVAKRCCPRVSSCLWFAH